MLNVKRLHKNAVLPTRGSIYAAGLDLYAVGPGVLLPGERATIPTGIAVELPVATVGLIWPRSKLAAKCGIDVLAGVIDADYRGEIHVCLLNTGTNTITIAPGDRVAQMVIQRFLPVNVVEVTELSPSSRGEKGITCDELRLAGGV